MNLGLKPAQVHVGPQSQLSRAIGLVQQAQHVVTCRTAKPDLQVWRSIMNQFICKLCKENPQINITQIESVQS